MESGHYADYLRSSQMGPEPEADEEAGVVADLALQLLITVVRNA